MQRAPLGIPRLGDKAVATKQQAEQLQAVARLEAVQLGLHAGHAQQGGEVDLEKVLGSRTGILPIQSPDGAIGEQTPFDGAVAHDIDPRQVAQHLRGGCPEVAALAGSRRTLLAPVERARPTLGFQ